MGMNEFDEITSLLCLICFYSYADDRACGLWGKHFVRITLSCTISKIYVILHSTQKLKMVSKNVGKSFFGKKS